jgi:hypothetical protein
LINNRQGGRRRGRGGQRGPNLGGNRQDNRQRGNAAQLLEKYKNMARDAQLAGDRVQSEYYLQFADHYFRVLGESRARFEDQRRQRGEDSSDEDENESEDDIVEASENDREDDNRRQRGNGRDRSRRSDRSDPRQAESDEEEEERLPMAALPPAIGRDSDDDAEVATKPKRRARKPRGDSDDAEIAPAA